MGREKKPGAAPNHCAIVAQRIYYQDRAWPDRISIQALATDTMLSWSSAQCRRYFYDCTEVEVDSKCICIAIGGSRIRSCLVTGRSLQASLPRTHGLPGTSTPSRKDAYHPPEATACACRLQDTISGWSKLADLGLSEILCCTHPPELL